MDIPRYLSKRPLPPYAFIPGRNPHPEKKGGHMEGHQVEVAPLIPTAPFSNEDYLYGVDLFNHGFYWESHVWWEALWNEAARKGELADFLKGLIKLAAGGVKINLSQEEVSVGHLDRAEELLAPIARKHPIYCGLNLSELLQSCADLREKSRPFSELKLILKEQN
jgi:predicted metal-dependent hydrolase